MGEQRGMKRSTRFKVLWAVWMTGGGIATFLIVHLLTASIGWALLGLLASGIVLKSIGVRTTEP